MVRYARNYLRVRGEYEPPHLIGGGILELPPRARRIPRISPLGRCSMGTTSACAENTARSNNCSSSSAELPPRARRIRLGQDQGYRRNGTTSACAENTRDIDGLEVGNRNYLRVRGEYESAGTATLLVKELPPRARRILPSNSA